MTDQLVDEIEKNARERLRVSPDEFRGYYRLLSIRVWFRSEDGTFRPGREGFAIKVEKLDELLSALHRARGLAGELEWLPSAIREATRGRIK